MIYSNGNACSDLGVLKVHRESQHSSGRDHHFLAVKHYMHEKRLKLVCSSAAAAAQKSLILHKNSTLFLPKLIALQLRRREYISKESFLLLCVQVRMRVLLQLLLDRSFSSFRLFFLQR